MKTSSKLLALFALTSALASASPVFYTFSVDTQAASGTQAELFFQLAPGGPGADSGQAIVDNLSGFMPASPGFVLDNALNPLVQLSVTLGSSLDFTVVLAGTMVSSPSGSGDVNTFSLSIFTQSYDPLFTSDPLGVLALVDVLPDGSTLLSDLSNGELSSDGPTPVPEPAAYAMLGAGLAGLMLLRRR